MKAAQREFEMKKSKLCLCGMCHGTGLVRDGDLGIDVDCPQCEGSGRVWVYTEGRVKVTAYRPHLA